MNITDGETFDQWILFLRFTITSKLWEFFSWWYAGGSDSFTNYIQLTLTYMVPGIEMGRGFLKENDFSALPFHAHGIPANFAFYLRILIFFFEVRPLGIHAINLLFIPWMSTYYALEAPDIAWHGSLNILSAPGLWFDPLNTRSWIGNLQEIFLDAQYPGVSPDIILEKPNSINTLK